MAKVLNYESQIQQNKTVQSWHVSQSVDAFTGAQDYAISISGSLNLTSSLSIAPGNLLTTGQSQYLSYNPSTGQVFRANTSSIGALIGGEGFQVYKTGSSNDNIVPAKFGSNQANGTFAVVSAGQNNSASGASSFIGGGARNCVTGIVSAVVGGNQNTSSAHCGIIGAGQCNVLNNQSQYGGIVSGFRNTLSSGYF